MNYFTRQSIELANQHNYLDLLFSVYPLSPDTIRVIDTDVWSEIKDSFQQFDNKRLFQALLKLKLFPIKDGYVPYFKHDPNAIDRNPKTVNRICGRIHEMNLNELYQRCTQPKETNRQMGPLFQRWVGKGSLGLEPVPQYVFESSENDAILAGTNKSLMEFAHMNLGYSRNKGIDFIARFNKQYVIGEAKFISDESEHQNDQFLDAMATIQTSTKGNVHNIAILDGVLYIKSRKKMYQTITTNDLPVMSALVLRDYLFSL